MSAHVLNLKTTGDRNDVVHRAVEALAAGMVIAVPTETVYGLAALATNSEAVARLLALKGRPEGNPVALAVKGIDDARDYAPAMPPLARRLARRCWPGPVTLVVDYTPEETSLIEHLPDSVRVAVALKGTVGLRVVAHSVVADILQYVTGPLVLTSANRSGRTDAVTAEEVATQFGDRVDLVLDDGPCRYGQPSSVIRVRGPDLEVLREGVVADGTIERLASFMVLMVCTGNTCRSPMAEILMRKHLADRFGCDMDEVEQRGAIVASAGISAGAGGRPSPEAVEVLHEMGLTLNGHLSQPVTDALVRHADLILTMTHGHRNTIVGHWPSAAERTELLRQDRRDISDPIGGPIAMYRRCAEQMDQELKTRVGGLEI